MISIYDESNFFNKLKWGTHFCYFYYNQDDLFNILGTYFQIGLENNEFCIFITSNDLNLELAKKILRDVVIDFDDYLKKGQIRILPCKNWYFKDNIINLKKVLEKFRFNIDQAILEGYSGLRTFSDLGWIKKTDLQKFIENEIYVNNLIEDMKIIALCTFPNGRFNEHEILNISGSYQFVLTKMKGNYKIIENMNEKRLKKKTKSINPKLQKKNEIERNNISLFGFAHDFKNLLNVIKGNAELAMIKIDQKNPTYKILEEIFNAIQSASNLILAMLDLNQPLSNRKKSININNNIEKIIDLLPFLIKENIIFKTNMESDLWSVCIGERKLDQIIINLVMNAKDAMPKGGVITIKTENIDFCNSLIKINRKIKTGKYVCLTIGDTGTGIKKSLFERIFEPNFTTKSLEIGNGFGLPIVYLYVSEINGWIDIQSEINNGTVFRIFFPAKFYS